VVVEVQAEDLTLLLVMAAAVAGQVAFFSLLQPLKLKLM
jgi:hypothetical protein